MVYVQAVHMSGGTHHQHIASVRWRNPADSSGGESTREEMVRWLRASSANVARVRGSDGSDVAVGVVDASPPYIRTYADGNWTDNLLALPRY
jgi:catechol-2,3-dioxygenase